MKNFSIYRADELETFQHIKITNFSTENIAECKNTAFERAEKYDNDSTLSQILDFIQNLKSAEIESVDLVYEAGQEEIEPCSIGLRCDPPKGAVYGPRTKWKIEILNGRTLRYCPDCAKDAIIKNNSVEEAILA